MSLPTKNKELFNLTKKPELLELIAVRMFQSQVIEIKQRVKDNPDRYENASHFIRVAIFKLLRETKR